MSDRTMCECGHHDYQHRPLTNHQRWPCLAGNVSDDRANLCPCKDYAPSAEPGRGNEPALEANRVEAPPSQARQAPEGVSLESPAEIAARCVPDFQERCRCGEVLPFDMGGERQNVAAEIERAERRGAARALRGLVEWWDTNPSFTADNPSGGHVINEAERRAEEQEQL